MKLNLKQATLAWILALFMGPVSCPAKNDPVLISALAGFGLSGAFVNYEMAVEGNLGPAVIADLACASGLILMRKDSGPCGPGGPYSFVGNSLVIGSMGILVGYPWVSMRAGWNENDGERVDRGKTAILAEAAAFTTTVLFSWWEQDKAVSKLKVGILPAQNGTNLVFTFRF